MTEPVSRRRVVLVSGLSGAGKSSILRGLEDLGYEAVDNPPLPLIEDLATRTDRNLAIGVDARTRGFDAASVLATCERLRADPTLRAELVYAYADEQALLARYTESRRRHPLAAGGRVAEGIAAEQRLTAKLRQGADLAVDTTELPLPALRRLVERHFATEGISTGKAGLEVGLVSFAYPAGLPREADLVFDARFLRNPHYDQKLRLGTGLDPEVAAYIEQDTDFTQYFDKICDLLGLLLPRFVQEGKKYATVAIGCTGGRHRSVWLVEKLASHLAPSGWHLHVTHRELAHAAETIRTRPPPPHATAPGEGQPTGGSGPATQGDPAAGPTAGANLLAAAREA